jgi:hypothetical protein
MTRSRTWYVDMSAAFPPDRPIAGLMARLMVIWADAVLEFDAMGIEDEGKGSVFERLDRLGPFYRRMLFWRSLSITLVSADHLLNAFKADAEFQGWMAADPEQQEQFNKSRREFLRNMKAAKTIRNGIGAHMEKELGEAPKYLQSGMRRPIEIHSEDVMRPRLATELLLAALVRDTPDENAVAKLTKLHADVAQAYEAMIHALGTIVALYSKHYPLLPQ